MVDTASIEANTSPVNDQAWALFRQCLIAGGGALVANGAISQNTLSTTIGVIMAIAPIVVGQLNTRLRAKQLASLALDPNVPQVVPKRAAGAKTPVP